MPQNPYGLRTGVDALGNSESYEGVPPNRAANVSRASRVKRERLRSRHPLDCRDERISDSFMAECLISLRRNTRVI
jgi:hypothetical protein